MIYLGVLIQTLFASAGAYFLKKGSAIAGNAGILTWFTIPSFYIGGIVYVLSFAVNIYLLHFIDYTVLYPMGALAYIWSMLIGFKFLGEGLTKNKIAGVLFIFLGIVLLTR